MKVWALEICFCKYKTGYQAEKALNEAKKKDSPNYLADGYRVVEWEVQDV